MSSFDPTLQLARLERVESEFYTGSGRNIFQAYAGKSGRAETLRPQPTLEPTSQVDIRTAVPDLRMFGYAILSGSSLKVCLLQDDDVFIGREGDIVDRRYRIERVHLDSVGLQDMLDNRQFTLAATK